MNRLPIIFMIFLMVALILIVTCAPRSGSILTTPSMAPTSTETLNAKSAWEIELDRLIPLAKKEGKVVVLHSAGGPVNNALSEAFNRKYQISTEMVAMAGAAGSAKLIAEQRAGLYLADIYIGGSQSILTGLKPAGILAPLEPTMVLPELVNPELIKKVWWRGKLRWLDNDHLNLAFLVATSPPVLINTDLVKEEEVKSYKDLLNPRYKGKIVLHDPTKPGFGSKLTTSLGEAIMGWDYVRQLSQQVVISFDTRQIAEWVAQGKYPVALGTALPTVVEVQRAGAHIKAFIPIEGIHITSSDGSVALLKNSPHPNAAKLFINWLLSKEGQTVYSQAYGQPSARLDVTTEGINQESIPKTDVEYLISDDEEWILKLPQQIEKVKEIFAPLLK